MGKRLLFDPDSQEEQFYFQRGESQAHTEGSGVNVVTTGQSNQAVTIGSQFAGQEVVNIDAEKGIEVKNENGDTTWISNNISPRLVPYLDANGGLNLFEAVNTGNITDLQDYVGFDNVTQQAIDDAKLFGQYKTDTGYDVTKAYKDGVDIETIERNFDLSPEQKSQIITPPEIEGVVADILPNPNENEADLASQNANTDAFNRLSDYISTDANGNQYIDVNKAKRDGVSDDDLLVAGVPQESIDKANEDNARYDRLSPFITTNTDGKQQVDINGALRNGVSEHDLLDAGISPDLINQAKETNAKMDMMSPFIQDIGNGEYIVNVDKALSEGASDEVLQMLNISPEMKREWELRNTYVNDAGNFDLARAIADGVPDAEIQKFIGKDALREYKAKESILNLFTNPDGTFNVFDAVRGLSNEQIKEVWDVDDDTLNKARDYNEFQDKGYYQNDQGETTLEYAMSKGATYDELLRMGFTPQDIKDYNDALNNARTEFFDWLKSSPLSDNAKLNAEKLYNAGKIEGAYTYVNNEVDKYNNALNADTQIINNFVTKQNAKYNQDGTIDNYIWSAPQDVLDAVNRLYGTDYQHGKYTDLYDNYSSWDEAIKVFKNKDEYDKSDWFSYHANRLNEEAQNNNTIKSAISTASKLSGFDNTLKFVNHFVNVADKLGAKITNNADFDTRSVVIKSIDDLYNKDVELQTNIRDWLHGGTLQQTFGNVLGTISEFGLSIANEVIVNDIVLDKGAIVLTGLSGAGKLGTEQEAQGQAELAGLAMSIITYPLTIPKTTKENTAQGVAEVASILIPDGKVKSVIGKVANTAKQVTFDVVKQAVNDVNQKIIVPNADGVKFAEATGKIKANSFEVNGTKIDINNQKAYFNPSGDIKAEVYKDITNGSEVTAVLSTDKTKWDNELNESVHQQLQALAQEFPDYKVNVVLGNLKESYDGKAVTQTFYDGKTDTIATYLIQDNKGINRKLEDIDKDGTMSVAVYNNTPAPKAELDIPVEKLSREITSFENQKQRIDSSVQTIFNRANERPTGLTIRERTQLKELLQKRTDVDLAIYTRTQNEVDLRQAQLDELNARFLLGEIDQKAYLESYAKIMKLNGKGKSKLKQSIISKLAPVLLAITMITSPVVADAGKFVEPVKIELSQKADMTTKLDDVDKMDISTKQETIKRQEATKQNVKETKQDAVKTNYNVVNAKNSLVNSERLQNAQDILNEFQNNVVNPTKELVNTKVNNAYDNTLKDVVTRVDTSIKNEAVKQNVENVKQDTTKQNVKQSVTETKQETNQETKQDVKQNVQNQIVNPFENTYKYQDETLKRFEQNMKRNVKSETTKTNTKTNLKLNMAKSSSKANNVIPRTENVVIAWRQGSLKIKGRMKPVWLVVKNVGGKLVQTYEYKTPAGAKRSSGKPYQTLFHTGKKVKPIRLKVGFNIVTIDFNKSGKEQIVFRKESGKHKTTWKGNYKLPSQSKLTRYAR